MSNDHDDWRTLIQLHLDGLTTEEQAAALSERIVDDGEVRAEYLKASRLHGALGDEVLCLDEEAASEHESATTLPPRAWPGQIAAALIGGALVGLLGAGVVWAMGSPKSEASVVPIANGDFETVAGAIDLGFPAQFGHWSGDPAEVVEEADGNQVLRFLETANVTGNPSGGASACNVFQLVDLSSVRERWASGDAEDQFTLELSAEFRRVAAPSDGELPKRPKATCTLFLFDAPPESIGKRWPMVIRDAVAVGNKAIKLNPDGTVKTISSACILEPEATIALISVNVNTMTGSQTPVELGGFFVDDVKLTVIKQPKLEVEFVR